MRWLNEWKRRRISRNAAMAMPDALFAPAGATPIRLRPLTELDEREWNELRMRNNAWLSPWESSDPTHRTMLSFSQWIALQRIDEREGRGALFAIELGGRIVGQISLGAVFLGSIRSGIVGYWIGQEYAGRGLVPLAVAMLADWALLDPEGPCLHRLEIDIVPTNARSRSVVRKVGAHYEGVRRSYMYINGEWKDHESYSLLPQDTRHGFVHDLLERHAESA